MFLLWALDIAFTCFFITPLTIGFWRGIWEFTNYYPESYPNSWVLLVGTILQIVSVVLQDKVIETCHNDISFQVLTRIYIYIFGIINVVSWRSLWGILDELIGFDSDMNIITTICSVALLVVMKGICNIGSVPFYTALDHKPENVFSYATMFKTMSSGDLWIYILDCGFSVCVVGTLVVFVWRGVWCLLDIYLYPGEMAASAWASLVIGYSLVLASFAAQPMMKGLVVSVSGLGRLCAVDLYLLFSFCGTINVWRGIWNLLNVYFIPEKPIVSFWLSHGISFLVLMLVNSSNSILVRGVYIDAEEEGEQCVDFPCYYIRLFFQEKRKKKLLKQMQKKHVENLSRRKSEADGFLREGDESPRLGRRSSLQLKLNTDSQEMV